MENLRKIIDNYIEAVESVNEHRAIAAKREYKFLMRELKIFNLLREKLRDLDDKLLRNVDTTPDPDKEFDPFND